MGVTVSGADRAEAYLSSLGQNVASSSHAVVRVGFSAPYAFGIETGETKTGRKARAAGGLFFLRGAYLEVKPEIGKYEVEALSRGESELEGRKRAGFEIERRAKERLTPFPYSPRTRYHTGGLRRSGQTVYPGRPTQAFTPVRRSRRAVRAR